LPERAWNANDGASLAQPGDHPRRVQPIMKQFFAPVAVLSLALLLAGCGGSVGGLGDGATVDPSLEDDANIPVEPSGVIAGLAQPDYPNCPKVAVLEGASFFRGRSSAAGASQVDFQATLADVARECRFDGSTMSMRVGVRGRILLGTRGRPGSWTVPVRVVLKRGSEVVFTNLTRVRVSVPSGSTQAAFQHVEDNIRVPQGPDGEDTYDVLVGFDQRG
jgi:hypothetical protein